MRLSKASETAKTQDYLVFETIADRNLAKDTLENGQEIKVLDASGDENIKSGWAIYKYDKQTDIFDLVEKSEQPNIPNPDGITVEPILDDKLRVVTALENYSHLMIMEDFQMKAEYNVYVKQIKIYPDPYPIRKMIPAKMYGNDRTFGVKNINITISGYTDLIQGKTFYAAIYSKLVQDDSNQMNYKLGLGTFPDLSFLDPENDVLLAIIKLPIPSNIEDTDKNSLVLHNIYKKAIAPAEQRIKIPGIPEIKADDSSIIECTYQGDDNKTFGSPENYNPFDERFKFLEDFDFKFENYQSGGVETIKMTANNPRQIKVNVNGVVKYLTLNFWVVDFQNMRTSAGAKTGDYIYFRLNAGVKNTEVFSPHSSSSNLGYITDAKTTYGSPNQILFSARVKLPDEGQEYDLTTLKVWKHWKKALAPAEERIIIPEPTAPEAVNIDNYTIEKTGDILTVPASLNPIRHNYTIRKNFQLDLNFDNKEFIRVTPRGADENGFLQIPIEKDGIVFALQLGTVDLPVSAFAGSPEMIHFGIMAKVESSQAPKVACEYIVEADGSPIKFEPSPTDLQICIAQIRAKKPVNTDGWREEFVTMWRYWETVLLETFSETPVDSYGTEYIENNGVKQITSIGAMTPNYYNLRYLQDFDFDFKVSYDSVNNTLNTIAIPTGGARTIKTTRAISDIDGIVLAKETLYPSVNTINNTMNDPEKGKFHYFHFGSNMPSVDTLQGMNATVSLTPNIRPQSNYYVTYGVIKIYIPKDGEPFDYGKVYLYKYWRNALASFDELIQDYQQRNP